MNTITVSATAARNNFFELLNQVVAGKQVIIKKDKKEVAVLSPKQQKTDWDGFWEASQAVHGILKDDDPNDNPLKKQGAWKRFGEWDKGLFPKMKA